LILEVIWVNNLNTTTRKGGNLKKKKREKKEKKIKFDWDIDVLESC
jgi:hypothetical protein